MITKKTFTVGGKKAVKVVLNLSKYIIPSIFFIKILEHSGWLIRIADFCAPYMSYLGLPGEGALVFLLGHVSMYSAIGVLATLGWTMKQITIMSVIVSMCHAITVETAIVIKGGANGLFNAAIRFLAAVITAAVLNIIIPGV